MIRHSLVLSRRSLAKTSRNPGPVINGVVSPALFLVIFLYLFGEHNSKQADGPDLAEVSGIANRGRPDF